MLKKMRGIMVNSQIWYEGVEDAREGGGGGKGGRQ